MSVESLVISVSGLLLAGLCVWLLVPVKRRLTNTGGRTSISSRDLIPIPPSSPPESRHETTSSTTPADALILGDVDNPLLEITPSDLSEGSSGIEVDPSMLSTLQPLLQRAPEFLRVGQDMTT